MIQAKQWLLLHLFCFLLWGCSLAGSGEAENISSDDQVFLENIVRTLGSLTGQFEIRPGPLVGTATGLSRVDIDVFSGDHSVFIRLGEIVDKHPAVTHQIISTLVDCLDDLKPTNVTYKNKPVPLGVVCYEALRRIVYHEEGDENGALIGWEGVVLRGASESELKVAKKAWKKVLAERTYSLL